MVAVNPSPTSSDDDEISPVTPPRTAPTVSVMIPTLNEAGNLPYVLNTVPSWVDEIVLVDGRSHDDTLRVAKLLHPGIRIVKELRRGKGPPCGPDSRRRRANTSSPSTPTGRWTEPRSVVFVMLWPTGPST